MLVEDDPFVRDVLEMALRKAGANDLELFGTGESAINAAAKSRPELVILDLNLPNLNGRDVALQLKGIITPAPQFIFITGHSAQDMDYLGSGIDPLGVLAKPFDPMTIVQQIQHLLTSQAETPVPLEDRLRAVRARFQKSLAAAAQTLSDNVSRLEEGGADQLSAIEALNDTAHTLAGSAGTFKFHKISDVADRVEQQASVLLKTEVSSRSKSELLELSNTAGELAALCGEAADGAG